MEKDPQPKTQPSGNKPPPRPPTRVAVGMLPDDEDPEKNRRRKVRREIVRINLPSRPLANPTIQLPVLPAAANVVLQKSPPARIEFEIEKENWPAVILLVLAIWAFIGAVVTMMLNFNFSGGHSNLSNLNTILVLLFLWAVPALFIRHSRPQAGKT